MSRTGLLALSLLLAGCLDGRPPADVGSPGRHGATEIFDRFDHRQHAAVLERVGLPCVACHAVGTMVPVEEGEDEAARAQAQAQADVLFTRAMEPPSRICHACHGQNNNADAPSRCRTCHDLENIEKPDSHGAGWLQNHQREAMTAALPCYDCHNSYTCVQCHVRRDTTNTKVHSGNWLTLHGMAARADPVPCEGCHEGGTCLQCHENPQGRQGW